MSDFKQYRRKEIAELRPWIPGEDLIDISVSAEDAKAGSPKSGDMIARNPKNHDDKWLIAAQYFADNFAALSAQPQPDAVEAVAWRIRVVDGSYCKVIPEGELDIWKQNWSHHLVSGHAILEPLGVIGTAFSAQPQPEAVEAVQWQFQSLDGRWHNCGKPDDEDFKAYPERLRALYTAPPLAPDVRLRRAIASCEGEQKKFEEWATAARYDMHEHPLHYLFLDAKTNAARMGWKAALRYVETLLPSRADEGKESEESRAKATEGKAGMAGVTDPVRQSTAGTGLRVGEADAVQPATSEIMDATAGETAPNSPAGADASNKSEGGEKAGAPVVSPEVEDTVSSLSQSVGALHPSDPTPPVHAINGPFASPVSTPPDATEDDEWASRLSGDETTEPDETGMRVRGNPRSHGESLQQGPDTTSTTGTAVKREANVRDAGNVANPVASSDRASHEVPVSSDPTPAEQAMRVARQSGASVHPRVTVIKQQAEQREAIARLRKMADSYIVDPTPVDAYDRFDVTYGDIRLLLALATRAGG